MPSHSKGKEMNFDQMALRDAYQVVRGLGDKLPFLKGNINWGAFTKWPNGHQLYVPTVIEGMWMGFEPRWVQSPTGAPNSSKTSMRIWCEAELSGPARGQLCRSCKFRERMRA